MIVDETKDENLFRVHSDTTDKTYIVDLEANTCDCTDWAIKRNRRMSQGIANPGAYQCKHILAALNRKRQGISKRAADIKMAARAEQVKTELLDSLRP